MRGTRASTPAATPPAPRLLQVGAPASAFLAASCFLAPALLLAACSLAPPPTLPEPAAELPDAFAETASADAAADPAADPDPAAAADPDPAAASPHDPHRWWTAFDDPVLNAVVDSALAANFDLAEAVARVQQAQAQAGIARAPLFPAVSAVAGVDDLDTPSNTGIGEQFREITGADSGLLPPGFEFPERFGYRTYSLAVGLSYELDFWGRARNDAKAAGMQYLASESDYAAARIGVLAATITTYFDVVALRRQAAVAAEMVGVLAERGELAETRYDRGLVTSFELYQVRQQLRNTQAGLPQLESAAIDAEGRLAVLLGGFRDKLDRILPDSLAPAPFAGEVAAGVPADLLLQRPDVCAAGQRLEAARFAIGARRAEQFPSLSLSGTIGVQSSEADGLFSVDQWFRNLVGNLTAPIFQGGRIRNRIALAQADFNMAAAAYGRTVVTAVHEVESALAAHEREGRRHDFLESQREEALASVALQSERYESGVGGYADYLDAVSSLLGVESTLAGARRDLALSRLAVHRALGGQWTPPPESLEGPRMIPAPESAPPPDSPGARNDASGARMDAPAIHNTHSNGAVR